jgi:hypothetical protein
MEAPADPQPMNRKLRYYYNHKDDPNFQARMAESKRKYYQAHREAIIAKSLTRYYQQKAMADAQPPMHP